jgi:hypothetical protein
VTTAWWIFEALANLPAWQLAADRCALFLRATDPLLPRSLALIEAWALSTRRFGLYRVKLNTSSKDDADFLHRWATGRARTPNNVLAAIVPTLWRPEVANTFQSAIGRQSGDPGLSRRVF